MLDKTYDAQSVEPKIRELWEKADAFRAGAGAEPGAEPFSIVIPPPNVTGSLHMGHALNNTLQDVLVRFERMRGKDVLWQPGMDHAGIATQMVVERQMMERQEPDRRAIGREAFVEKVWAWKAESGGMIINQLKRLGASCDWSRERFTMDEGLSRAVVKVFVQLYKEGLIYRDKRLVNWDPKLLTAISDLEVQQVEVKGYLWHFRYPIEGERPLHHGRDDAAGDDARRHRGRGASRGRALPRPRRQARRPAAGRPAHPDHRRRIRRPGSRLRRREDHARRTTSTTSRSAAGTTCRSSTSWTRRRNIRLRGNADFLKDVPPSAQLAETIDALDGLDRFTARESVVAMMEERELVEKTVEHTHTVPHGDRSGVPIEPFLTDQWYVERQDAGRARDRQRARRAHRFVPKNWEKTYFDWMENIQPWCISRQLWWGHRIPAWYGPDGDDLRRGDARRRREAAAERHYGHAVRSSTRDEDVLDTWFSSALWPFSTLGWPEETPELKRYYPTSVLVTGFDIIFFWVARMMMMGLHFMKEEPFHTVLHPRHRARREGRQDVEVEGERRRSPRADRRVRRRCAALHHGVAGDARARREAVARAHRGLPQFRHEDLERRALLRDERVPARSPASIRRVRARR